MNKNILLKIAILFLITISTQTLKAQKGYAWKKLGSTADTPYFANGLNVNKCINGEYYNVTGPSNHLIINKWNGLSWSSYPPLNLYGGGIRDLQVFNNQLYVSGAGFANVPLAQRNNDLPFQMIKFNGVNWDSIPTPPARDSSHYGGIDNLTICNGNMYYLSHSLTLAGSQTKIYKMTSAGVHTMIQSYHIKGGNYEDGSLCAQGDTLVIGGGEFDTLEYGKPTSGLAFYDGSKFRYLNTAKFSGVANLSGNGGVLYNPGLFSLNDSMLAFVALVLPEAEDKLVLLKNGALYKIIVNPDPNQSTYATISVTVKDHFLMPNYIYDACSYYYDLKTDQWVKGRREVVMVNNMASNKVYGFRYELGWPFRLRDFVELVNGTSVSGKLYIDIDSSCTFDTSDMVLKNTLIELDNGIDKYNAYSDANGNYEMSVVPGNYTIKYFLPSIQSSIAPCSTVNVNVVSDTISFDSTDLPVHISTNRNLAVSIDAYRGFRTRQGFTENYVLTGTNYSFRKDSVILKLKYPVKSTFVSSDIVPFSHSGNELVYKFANLEWRDTRRVNIRFSTSKNTSTMGDEISFYASVVNSSGDSMMENNDDSLRQKIVAAYDPNIKQSFPEGKVSPGLKKIKYVIHFQNTGRDTAFKVTVIDTFIQKLGLRSLRVTSTSHPATYAMRVENKQTLIWEFQNILLPDSHTNEKASHGYIAFEADINGHIAAGDSITNKAYIYFDYQEPVVTNTASVTIWKPDTDIKLVNLLNTHLTLYPNPASASVNVITDPQYDQKNILLYNSMGQLVSWKKINANMATFQVSNLPKGIYLVKIEGTGIVTKLLVE
jgi:hypothetical protein